MLPSPNKVAQVVLDQFNLLPSHRKPIVRSNGLHEWVPLSGIVLERGGTLRCISLAIGMKCLPTSKLPKAQGVGIHDWHAEVLATRAFNHFLLEEAHALIKQEQPGDESGLLRWRSADERYSRCGTWRGQPFALKDDVRLYFYCSEAPCGDASMELTMASQSDPCPWELPSDVPADGSLFGRGYFSQLGIVRRKPSRPDAPPTLSKSCSDKLSLKQCTSLLSGPTSLLISPTPAAYIKALILPTIQLCVSACQRSFSPDGRMAGIHTVADTWAHSGYSFVPFEVLPTDLEFAYSKRTVLDNLKNSTGGLATFGGATVWHCRGLEESLVAGVLRGRKPFDTRGASGVSRRRIWSRTIELAQLLNENGNELVREINVENYRHLKEGPLLAARREVKEQVRSIALKEWMCSQEDLDFGAMLASSPNSK